MEIEQAEQLSLFVADHQERNPRCIQDIMAYPYFALSKRRRIKPMQFVSTKGDIEIKVQGLADYGIASIYDADILLWLAAEIRRHYEKTGEARRIVQFRPRVMLKQLGRSKGGKQMQNLLSALERLKTTYIRTSVRQEHQKKEGGFSWIDSWFTAEDRSTGTPPLWSVTVSDWLFQGILQDHNILTLNPGYYRLAGGLEKRLYQIARKHAGMQQFGNFITMEALYSKAGSGDELKYFARQVREIADRGFLLDYAVSAGHHGSTEKIWFRHQSFLIDAAPRKATH